MYELLQKGNVNKAFESALKLDDDDLILELCKYD